MDEKKELTNEETSEISGGRHQGKRFHLAYGGPCVKPKPPIRPKLPKHSLPPIKPPMQTGFKRSDSKK